MPGPKQKTKPVDRQVLIAKALRGYAKRMLDTPGDYSREEGQALDRALRSCKGISDIDVVWVRWSYVAATQGWLTDNELELNKLGTGYRYPEKEEA